MRKIIVFVIVLLFNTNVYAASVADLMNTAAEPVGKCLYVYGGGWNEADTGAGIDAMTMGISRKWVDFYNANNGSYNYKNTMYQIHNGLDCTGYIGWCMYQLFQDSYSSSGYVYKSKIMAKTYADLFAGKYIQKDKITDYECGDIMSSSGHVYIVVGKCDDGSVLFFHASPPNVSLCGTYRPDGNSNSEAIAIATEYMNKYFNECYKKYPKCSRGTSYLTDYNQMRWNKNVLTDSDGYRNMKPREILHDMFENIKIYVNDVRVAKNEQIYLIDGTTYVPLRAVSESMGIGVSWFDKEKKVRLFKDGKEIDVFVNSLQNKSAFIQNNRTYVPVRFISENLGAYVSWEQKTKSVKIYRSE